MRKAGSGDDEPAGRGCGSGGVLPDCFRHFAGYLSERFPTTEITRFYFFFITFLFFSGRFFSAGFEIDFFFRFQGVGVHRLRCPVSEKKSIEKADRFFGEKSFAGFRSVIGKAIPPDVCRDLLRHRRSSEGGGGGGMSNGNLLVFLLAFLLGFLRRCG